MKPIKLESIELLTLLKITQTLADTSQEMGDEDSADVLFVLVMKVLNNTNIFEGTAQLIYLPEHSVELALLQSCTNKYLEFLLDTGQDAETISYCRILCDKLHV